MLFFKALSAVVFFMLSSTIQADHDKTTCAKQFRFKLNRICKYEGYPTGKKNASAIKCTGTECTLEE
eukprot:Pgem_evm1s11410